MKKLLCLCLILFLLSGCLSSCGKPAAQEAPHEDSLLIVASIFPEYDWLRVILGDDSEAELIWLADNGVDLHSFQPTAEDIRRIADCDLFVCVGGESDQWVEEALREATNPDMQVLRLLELLGDAVREEERSEGMQDSGEEETAPDEHVWLSLRNASLCCGAFAETLSALDPENASIYTANAAAYQEELEELDRQYQEAVGQGSVKTLLFGDRFPFLYLTEDYDLDYYAAFAGCAAETEASFGTITFLAGKVDELSLPCVLTIEGSVHRIAETIVENTERKDLPILTLNSLQSVTREDMENGDSYLSLMQDNLEVLRQALQ